MRHWTTRSLTFGIALSVALLALGSIPGPAAAQYRGEDVVYPGDIPLAPPPPPPNATPHGFYATDRNCITVE